MVGSPDLGVLFWAYGEDGFGGVLFWVRNGEDGFGGTNKVDGVSIG